MDTSSLGRQHDAPHPPCIQGNTLTTADGTRLQLRALDVLYFRCGVVTIEHLEKVYREARR